MKNLKFLPMVMIMALLISCAHSVKEADSTADTLMPEQAREAMVPNSDLYSTAKTKIIKTLRYRFEVDHVKKSTEAIETAVKKYPAYISGSNLHLENPILENRITIRVQSEYFEDLLKEIDPLARFVNYREVKTEDVAKEFVDLESRLKTKREVEERYTEILRKKAGTVEELLKAEAQIGALHEEIEATISRINYLKDQVSYSTLYLEFYQTITMDISVADQVSFGSEFKTALKAGWDGTTNVIIAIAYIWPLLLLVAGIGVLYRYIKRQHLSGFKGIAEK